MPPGQCAEIRQKEITAGVNFLYCLRPGKPAEVESVHFDASKFTAAEAKAWLKRNNLSADEFIPAKGGKADAAEPDLGILARSEVAELRASATGLCEIEAQPDPSAPPRVNMLAYTGVPMKLDGFHLPVVVDLESLKVPRQKVPILRSHDADRVAGHSDKIDVSAQRLKASGVLHGETPQTTDLIHAAKYGFPWQVSIGAQTTKRVEHVPAGESVKVNGRNWDGPILVARGAVLRELSLLPMGADGNTDAGFSAAAAADVVAYSDDQPRDDRGRFSSEGGGGGNHNVKLPKDPKRLTIDQAHAALKEMGYKVEGRSFDMGSKTAFTHVVKPDGSKAKLSADQVKQIVYSGVKGAVDIDIVATTFLETLEAHQEALGDKGG